MQNWTLGTLPCTLYAMIHCVEMTLMSQMCCMSGINGTQVHRLGGKQKLIETVMDIELQVE